jgi:hypothetical protein
VPRADAAHFGEEWHAAKLRSREEIDDVGT